MVNKLLDEDECPIDIYICQFINAHLQIYYDLGFTPNIITTFSILFGLLSAYQIIKGRFIWSAILLLISYYLDCVDGKLARKYNMVTEFGDIYDHVGDIVKIIAVISALLTSNTKNFTNKQWVFINILLLITIIQFMHLGYQEAIYNKKEESPFLNIWRKMISCDPNPNKTIQYTKYFGCGTWYLYLALVIIFWRK